MQKDRFIVSLLVCNHYGVLTRISGLFSKRGFNIDSLTVGETNIPNLSRMTIMTTGDDYIKSQIVLQLQKLVDVKTVQLMDLEHTVVRELLLVKVGVNAGQRAEIMEAVQVFRAKVVDLSPSSMSIELTGEVSKIDAFLTYVQPFGIVELCRTGVTAIGRNSYNLEVEDGAY